MRIDLHLHTEASKDCSSPYREVLERLRAREIGVQAVTDHDTIEGALRLRELAHEDGEGPQVIVGEEITTSEGELIGLFLEELVPPGLSPEETIERIRAQGGLVLLPHGFDPLKAMRLKPRARRRVASRIDIVEAFNARVSRPTRNAEARAWAAARDVAVSAGTDAHRVADVGIAWVEAPERAITGPDALLAALREGEIHGDWTHPLWAVLQKGADRALRSVRRRLPF